jgi:hypothetical protein
MPAFRFVVSVLLRELGDFSLHLKAGPAGGRLRRPSSRRRRSGGDRRTDLTLLHTQTTGTPHSSRSAATAPMAASRRPPAAPSSTPWSPTPLLAASYDLLFGRTGSRAASPPRPACSAPAPDVTDVRQPVARSSADGQTPDRPGAGTERPGGSRRRRSGSGPLFRRRSGELL